MEQAKAYGKEKREWTFVGRTKASPENVYDALADLSSILDWSGRRQYKMFRLLSLEAPPGPAQVGTVFQSVGTIPMASTRWQNHSTVTKAARPTLFEVTTEGRIPWRKGAPGEGTFINVFEIEPAGTGSRVTYRAKQLRFRNPPWGLRYPLLRNMTYRVSIPMWFRRGFRNLLKTAEERAR